MLTGSMTITLEVIYIIFTLSIIFAWRLSSKFTVINIFLTKRTLKSFSTITNWLLKQNKEFKCNNVNFIVNGNILFSQNGSS